MREQYLTPWEQALQKYPKRWYEDKDVHKLALVSLSTLMIFGRLASIGLPVAAHVAGGALYALSAVVDELSTVECFRTIDRGMKVGVDEGIEETNPFLSARTGEEYRRRGLRRLGLDVGFTATGALFPELGFGGAAAKLMTAATNRRITKRLNYVIDIAVRARNASTNVH